jgi:hypothetical protein
MGNRVEVIEVKQNLIITARERGKIIARREGHNIWLDLGREYLAQLLAYSLMSPLTAERDDRIRYMGVGIGGNKQLALGVANAEPYLSAYPGTNAQTDSDPSVTTLERPVRVNGSEGAPIGTDEWLGQIAAPATHPTASQVKFIRTFSTTDVSYGSFLSVPLCEVGLYTGLADINVYNNSMVAYDTFDTISKTVAFELEFDWTIRF